ncbi:hypothetical protein GOV04_05400 [Candidatus Woesearchaeota archaeon]|nr:hypothetical protein [Candidatus Woesearchaeota archaeon]
MKLFHNITISVFAPPEEDQEQIKSALLKLVSIEKILLKESKTVGFNDRQIIVYEIKLEKQRHITEFFNNLKKQLSVEQKELLLKQLDSRLDNDLFFYLRLDKNKLLNNEYIIVDSGNCFHIKFSIAVYPAKREKAIDLLEENFK